MRFFLLLLLSLETGFSYADYPLPIPSPPSTQNGAPGNDSFGTLVQQQTTQALQVFQGVNYSKLSGSESQDSFFSDDGSDDNAPDPAHLFNLFAGS